MSHISSNSGGTQSSLQNRLSIMGDVVLSGLFNKNNNMCSVASRCRVDGALFPGAFFFLPHSKCLSLIALSCVVLEKHTKRKRSTGIRCARSAPHTRRDPSQPLLEVPLIVTSQRDLSVPNFTIIYREHKINMSWRLMVQKGPLVDFKQFGTQQQVFNSAPRFTTKHIRPGSLDTLLK